MRLGILTGGGDCPGLNAVIRAAVIRTIRTYEGHVVGFKNGWAGLIHGHARELDFEAIAGILPRGGTILGTSRVDPVREAGSVDALREAFQLHELDGLLVCGGDGTLSAAARLYKDGLPIVGIPKTIDDDIPGTDRSVGFHTALATVVNAVDALHTTAESHDRVIVVEVMGRSSGWLAICAGIAGGADVVVAPEDPVSMHQVCEFLRHRRARGREFSIVVVAEGASFLPDPDGTLVENPRKLDAVGRVVYGGIGGVLAREIERRLHIETRTVALGYVQRGGTPSAFDRLLGSRMGLAAVDLAAKGQFGRLVSLQGGTITSVDLAIVREGRRPVTPELVETARAFYG